MEVYIYKEIKYNGIYKFNSAIKIDIFIVKKINRIADIFVNINNYQRYSVDLYFINYINVWLTRLIR